MDENTKLTRTLNAIFLALCAAGLLTLALVFILNDCASAAPALLCAALCAAVFCVCRFAVPLLERVSAKVVCAAFYILLAAWLALSLTYAAAALPVPRGDFEAVHTGVKEAVELGRLTDSNPYFLRYAHQRGTLMALSLYFYILQRLGICATVNVLAGVILVRVGAALGTALAFDAARRVWGAPRAFVAGLLALLSPALFTERAYYSTALGIPLAALSVWLYVLARQCTGTRWRKAALYALCGGSLAVASTIAGVVNVLVAAVVIHLFLTSGFKGFLKRLAALAAGFAILSAGFQGAIRYGGLIDFTDEQKELLPMGYWFMVSLKGDGLYSEDDYQYIVSLPDYDARAEYTSGEIARLLRESTPAGLVKHALSKTRLTWTQSGSYVQTGGFWDEYAAAYGTALALLWLAGALGAIRRRAPDARTLWLLLVFGLFFFFCLWETKPGAAVTFIPELCAFGAFALFPAGSSTRSA